MKNKILRFIVSLVVGVGLLLLTMRYFDLEETFAAIREARLDRLVLALVMLVLAYLLRGRRWMIWESDLSYWNSFKLILVGFMGNNIMPVRFGEVLRAHCAVTRIKNTHGRTATLASIAIERILDGFVIGMIGLLGLASITIETKLSWALAFVCVLFIFLTMSLIIGIYFHKRIRRLCNRIHQIFPGHLTSFGMEKVSYFLDGLLMIRRPRVMLKALAATGIIWGVELLSYFLIADAILPEISFKISLIFLPVVNFASLFPFTVGGLGAIEGATAPFLINAGIPPNSSLAIVLIQHGYQFFFTTLVGGVFFFTNKYFEIPIVQDSKEFKDAPKPDLPEGDVVIQDTLVDLEQLSQELNVPRKLKPAVELSIVIPAFNEKNRLPKTILETIKWCKSRCPNYEIIVVDDGSTDETLEISRLFTEYDEHIKVIANPHLGKGAAVRCGMLNASGRHVLFMDADGATPLDEILKLRAKLEEGYAIAIGSRIVQSSERTKVVTSLHRKMIGRVFAAIVNIFGVSGIGDTQCGFKMFRKNVVKEIFAQQKLNGFAFDVEILYLAKCFSYEVKEVPVNWINKKGSKVNLISDSVKMLIDVLRISVLHMNSTFTQVNKSYGSDEYKKH